MGRQDEDEDRPKRHRYREPKNQINWILIGVIAGAVVIVGCFGLIFLKLKSPKEEQEKGQAANYKKMTASELLDDWAKNPAVAGDKYKTQPVEVVGVLNRMDSASGNDIWVHIGDGSGIWSREVLLVVETPQAKEGLKRCAVGKRVIFKGRADGKAHDRPRIIADNVEPGE